SLLRFHLSKGTVTVSLQDVLNNGAVYVPDYGLFISSLPEKQTLSDYLKSIESRKTVLEQVCELPEQTRQQAMAKTHYNPALDTGRMMLSLACGNDKFITQRDGTITFVEDYTRDERGRQPTLHLASVFGRQSLLGFTQGWGNPGINKAAHSLPDLALPMQIKDKHYSAGLGHHANGEILIGLQGRYSRFQAEVGLQWQGGNTPGSVVFEVLLDEKTVFNSGIMREHDDPKSIDLDVTGVQRLMLRVGDAGDGIGFDAANWAEARLTSADPSDADEFLTEFFEKVPEYTRHLSGGWLPAPVVTTVMGDLFYSQRTFVVPYGADLEQTSPEWFSPQALC
ncbi:MAG TPA: NPCBM/NEW2 domain-containing protein, partial [bacterium]|nr:NPCBM/NEW2 domain-containing protein [bacterium]